MESDEKVCSPVQFDGQDVLRKRDFTRKPGSKGRVEFSYKRAGQLWLLHVALILLLFELESHSDLLYSALYGGQFCD